MMKHAGSSSRSSKPRAGGGAEHQHLSNRAWRVRRVRDMLKARVGEMRGANEPVPPALGRALGDFQHQLRVLEWRIRTLDR
jgi:hypothetical protein